MQWPETCFCYSPMGDWMLLGTAGLLSHGLCFEQGRPSDLRVRGLCATGIQVMVYLIHLKAMYHESLLYVPRTAPVLRRKSASDVMIWFGPILTSGPYLLPASSRASDSLVLVAALIIHRLETDASHGPGICRSRYQDITAEATNHKSMEVPRTRRDRNATVSIPVQSIVDWLFRPMKTMIFRVRYLYGKNRCFWVGTRGFYTVYVCRFSRRQVA